MILFVFISIIAIMLGFFAERLDSRICAISSALILALYSGLRGPDVGIDTAQYYHFYNEIELGHRVFGVEDSFIKFCEFLQNYSSDPALMVFVLSFFTNILIVGRLWTFRRKSCFAVMLAIYVAGYYPESMNVMRQFFAVALIFFGTWFLEKKKPLLFLPFAVFAVFMHTTALVGFTLLFLYLWNTDCEYKKLMRFFIAVLFAMGTYVGYGMLSDALLMYSRYFETVKQNIGFMLLYKMIGFCFICYISKFGLIRKGSWIVGLEKIDLIPAVVYLLGIFLCSLGMFFPYMDRIGLYFLMFEMPFWGWAIKNRELTLAYKSMTFVFIAYLYIMNLLYDGQQIFPYSSILVG